MVHRATVAVLAFSLVGAACGKSSKEPAADPKIAEAVPANPGDKGVAPPVKAPPRGPEHAVYSLVANRLSAHLSRGGGLLVPAGSAGFAKYVRIGNALRGAKPSWELRQSEGDVRVARMTGKVASVFIPLTAAQAGHGLVRMRVFGTADGPLSIRVNDHKDLNAQLTKGWSTVEVTVPAGQLVAGENTLELFTKHAGTELAWLQAGGSTPVGDDGAVAFYDPAARSLVLPKGGGMSWYAVVPGQGKLTGDLADGACRIDVVATAADGAVAEGKLTGLGSAVDLAALAGKAARIDLLAAGCPTAHLAKAALVVPGERPQIKRGAPPKYVLFIVMDALRFDRIRAFFPEARPETPTFDKLAKSSTLFMNAYVQGNESQVSHASIWSSTYLAKHKAIEMHDHLADKWTTIDEVAKKARKYVAGASGNGFIRPSRGFGHGWDQFVNHIVKSLGLHGSDIIEKGLSFITPHKDRPWFLYLGLIDTHVTYRAKEPWLDKYDPGYKGRFATSYGDSGKGHGEMTDREKEHVRALYDSNVSYQDDQLGKLIEKLEGWGVWDDTMLIVVADHGEELWEDGRAGHGGSLRETLLHVPLLVHYPPLFPAGKVTEGVEGIDIVPTLADALGVPTDPEWQGRSLIPLANGDGGYPLMSFASEYENSHAGRIGHWKLRLSGTGTPHLYDLAKDPNEHEDRWGTPGSAIGARLLLDPMWLLRQWNVEWKKAQWGNAADVSDRFASDLGE